jgi:hypothetical protein
MFKKDDLKWSFNSKKEKICVNPHEFVNHYRNVENKTLQEIADMLKVSIGSIQNYIKDKKARASIFEKFYNSRIEVFNIEDLPNISDIDSKKFLENITKAVVFQNNIEKRFSNLMSTTLESIKNQEEELRKLTLAATEPMAKTLSDFVEQMDSLGNFFKSLKLGDFAEQRAKMENSVKSLPNLSNVAIPSYSPEDIGIKTERPLEVIKDLSNYAQEIAKSAKNLEKMASRFFKMAEKFLQNQK